MLQRELSSLLFVHEWDEGRCACGWGQIKGDRYVSDHCEHQAKQVLKLLRRLLDHDRRAE